MNFDDPEMARAAAEARAVLAARMAPGQAVTRAGTMLRMVQQGFRDMQETDQDRILLGFLGVVVFGRSMTLVMQNLRRMTTTINNKAQVSLPSDTEVRVTRDFKAPRTLVWQAHTDATLVPRWIGGYPGWTMPVCEMDVRPGGKYRWRWRADEDGKEFGFHGDYREVDAPGKMVHAVRSLVNCNDRYAAGAISPRVRNSLYVRVVEMIGRGRAAMRPPSRNLRLGSRHDAQRRDQPDTGFAVQHPGSSILQGSRPTRESRVGIDDGDIWPDEPNFSRGDRRALVGCCRHGLRVGGLNRRTTLRASLL